MAGPSQVSLLPVGGMHALAITRFIAALTENMSGRNAQRGKAIEGATMSMQSPAAEVTPKEVLLRFYEAETKYMEAFQENGAASFDQMRETMSADVVLHQSPDLPFGGDYAGYEGYERWAAKMGSIFDKLEVTEREFFEHGDKVIVMCRFITRSRINGSVQDSPMAQVVTVRNGEIVDFRPFYWNVPAYVAAAAR